MDLNSAFPLVALTQSEVLNLLPLFTISFGALFSLIAGTNKEKGRGYAFIMAFSFLVLALIQGGYLIFSSDITLLGGTLTFSPFTKTLNLMIMFFALIGVVLTYGQDLKEGLLSEIYALILFATAGMILMVSTTHLLFMFIALEIMSLAVYVMVAMRRNS